MQNGYNGLYGRFLYSSKNCVRVAHVPFFRNTCLLLFCFLLLLLEKLFLGQLYFFRASSHQIVHKMNTLNNFLFQPSYLNSNFALSLGYLNPALKNQARLFLRYGSVNYTAKGRLPGDHLAVMMMMTMTMMMMMSIPCRLRRDVRPGL